MYKLVIGIGNELRADDGAGAVIVRRLEHYALPGVQTEIITQLTPEWLERMSGAVLTILVDVRITEAADEGTVLLQKLTPAQVGSSSGHALNIAELIALGERIYAKPLEVWVCSVPAYDFTFGNSISEKCMEQIDKALQQILLFLKGL